MSNATAHQIIVDTIYDPDVSNPVESAEQTATLIINNLAENGIFILTGRLLSNIIAQAVLDGEG